MQPWPCVTPPFERPEGRGPSAAEGKEAIALTALVVLARIQVELMVTFGYD